MLSYLFAALISGCGASDTGAIATRAPALAPASTGRLVRCLRPHPADDLHAWAGAPAAAVSGVSLLEYGARCDGATDDTAAIQRGIAAAKAANQPLLIPAGQCNFSSALRLNGARMVGTGPASVLYASNWQDAAIFMYGAAPAVSHVKLAGVAAPARQTSLETCKIAVVGALGFVIDHVTIEGAPGAGIHLTQGASGGRLTHNVVRNTLADSIHMTDGTNQILLEGNVIENSGDDGIAVVSYKSDAKRVSNITARNNIVRNNKSGRNMSVVGGTRVLYENNLMTGNLAGLACLYLAQEDSWSTYTVQDVIANRNTLRDCGSRRTGHAAAMIFADGTEPNNNITLLSNDIVQNGQGGIRYFGVQTDIRLEQNRITGAGTAYVGRSDPNVTITPYTGGAVGFVPR